MTSLGSMAFFLNYHALKYLAQFFSGLKTLFLIVIYVFAYLLLFPSGGSPTRRIKSSHEQPIGGCQCQSIKAWLLWCVNQGSIQRTEGYSLDAARRLHLEHFEVTFASRTSQWHTDLLASWHTNLLAYWHTNLLAYWPTSLLTPNSI